MQNLSYLELEQEISKLSSILMARDLRIGRVLLENLRNQLSPEDMAGIALVSLERVIWFDPNAVIWAIDHLIPPDVMQEVRSVISLTAYKRLIAKGLTPGKDFSVDSVGKLLLNHKAKALVLG